VARRRSGTRMRYACDSPAAASRSNTNSPSTSRRRSPTAPAPVRPLQPLLERLGHQRRQRATRGARVSSHPTHQPRRQPHGEHHRRLGHRHPTQLTRSIDIPAGLPLREPESAGDLPGRVRSRHPVIKQFGRGVDAPRPLIRSRPTATVTHFYMELHRASHRSAHLRRPASKLERHLELEVATCVGGVTTPPCGVPSSVAARRPWSTTPALSQPSTSPLAGNVPNAANRAE
jgi:hypothetical protein